MAPGPNILNSAIAVPQIKSTVVLWTNYLGIGVKIVCDGQYSVIGCLLICALREARKHVRVYSDEKSWDRLQHAFDPSENNQFSE